MNGTLILRLVDITLLLLLSLMAAASFTNMRIEPPVTRELEDEGALAEPLRIEVAADGSIHVQKGGILTMPELEVLLNSSPRAIEFMADAEASARQLLDLHALIMDQEQSAAFTVRQVSHQTP